MCCILWQLRWCIYISSLLHEQLDGEIEPSANHSINDKSELSLYNYPWIFIFQLERVSKCNVFFFFSVLDAAIYGQNKCDLSLTFNK